MKLDSFYFKLSEICWLLLRNETNNNKNCKTSLVLQIKQFAWFLRQSFLIIFPFLQTNKDLFSVSGTEQQQQPKKSKLNQSNKDRQKEKNTLIENKQTHRERETTSGIQFYHQFEIDQINLFSNRTESRDTKHNQIKTIFFFVWNSNVFLKHSRSVEQYELNLAPNILFTLSLSFWQLHFFSSLCRYNNFDSYFFLFCWIFEFVEFHWRKNEEFSGVMMLIRFFIVVFYSNFDHIFFVIDFFSACCLFIFLTKSIFFCFFETQKNKLSLELTSGSIGHIWNIFFFFERFSTTAEASNGNDYCYLTIMVIANFFSKGIFLFSFAFLFLGPLGSPYVLVLIIINVSIRYFLTFLYFFLSIHDLFFVVDLQPFVRKQLLQTKWIITVAVVVVVFLSFLHGSSNSPEKN